MVLHGVERRFGTVPAGLEERLGEMKEVTQLEAILYVAITAAGIEVIQTALENGTANGQNA
jgi:hypothetical protein